MRRGAHTSSREDSKNDFSGCPCRADRTGGSSLRPIVAGSIKLPQPAGAVGCAAQRRAAAPTRAASHALRYALPPSGFPHASRYRRRRPNPKRSPRCDSWKWRRPLLRPTANDSNYSSPRRTVQCGEAWRDGLAVRRVDARRAAGGVACVENR